LAGNLKLPTKLAPKPRLPIDCAHKQPAFDAHLALVAAIGALPMKGL
jgi:hypothetical protein